MRNVFLTLFVAGVWHGAGWTFVVLGIYFGTLVALYHAYRRFTRSYLRNKGVLDNSIYKWMTTGLTCALTGFSATLFRAPDLHTDAVILGKLVHFGDIFGDIQTSISHGNWSPLTLMAAVSVVYFFGPLWVRVYQRIYQPLPYAFKVQAATAALVICWIFVSDQAQPFIYFKF